MYSFKYQKENHRFVSCWKAELCSFEKNIRYLINNYEDKLYYADHSSYYNKIQPHKQFIHNCLIQDVYGISLLRFTM